MSNKFKERTNMETLQTRTGATIGSLKSNTRSYKNFLKRSQISKINKLANRVVQDFLDDIKNQEGDYVTISKIRLKWLIDLVRWQR